MSKNATKKEILREMKRLRKELGGRLDVLERRLDDLVPPASSGPKSAGPKRSKRVSGPATVLPSRASGTVRTVTVNVQPLTDLGLARVVESALADTEGVESASLRELSGDSAAIDANVHDGVPLISSLRRRLPVAFDVTDSDRDFFTIALAQPESEREGGVATPESL